MVISERRIAVSKEMEVRVEASRGLLGAVKLKGTTGATSKLELTLTTSRGGCMGVIVLRGTQNHSCLRLCN